MKALNVMLYAFLCVFRVLTRNLVSKLSSQIITLKVEEVAMERTICIKAYLKGRKFYSEKCNIIWGIS